MSETPNPMRRALTDIEYATGGARSAVRALILVAETMGTTEEADAVAYLASRLSEHLEDAQTSIENAIKETHHA